jgi:hypothetical protein
MVVAAALPAPAARAGMEPLIPPLAKPGALALGAAAGARLVVVAAQACWCPPREVQAAPVALAAAAGVGSLGLLRATTPATVGHMAAGQPGLSTGDAHGGEGVPAVWRGVMVLRWCPAVDRPAAGPACERPHSATHAGAVPQTCFTTHTAAGSLPAVWRFSIPGGCARYH